MIANVNYKITMRARALFAKINPETLATGALDLLLGTTPHPCGHTGDWRCMLASLLANELPGTQVTVFAFTATLDLPLAYHRTGATVKVTIPPSTRYAMQTAMITPDLGDRRFAGCSIQITRSLPATGGAHRRGTR